MTPVDLSAAGYDVKRELGAGGMATVYLAHDQKHGRDVAVKVLKPDLAASLGRERFLREIQLAAKLSHPHILPVHDSGEAGGALFFVMPSVEGQSLRDRMASPLAVGDAVRIAQDIASALDYAHRHDVVHRDIKPENIMLQDGHALVADFGIGKMLGDISDDTLTQVGTSLGTPAYMSPEQAVGETVDGRSDIYSLGCVLYEMLVGEPPFTGPNAQAVIAKRFVQTPADVMALREGVPRPVARALQKALARAPIDRFHSAADLLTMLREADVESAPEAKAPSPQKSIAVLPFENLSSDRENEFFGDGIAEEIINALAQIEGLQVAARTSAFSFKGKQQDLRTIGEKLNVATVLEGSVRRSGSRIRITAQLIDVADGYHLWSERYDRELLDVFAVQDEIASAIAAKLQLTLDTTVAPTREPATPQMVQAFELHARARALLARRSDLPGTVALFEQVLVLDPSHARSHAGIAEATRLLAQFGVVPREIAIPRARESIARALELDPDLAEALGTSAVIALSLENDIDGAMRDWERSLAIDPAYADARVMRAEYGYLFMLGDDERAMEEARRAASDDPRSGVVLAIAAQTFLFAGRLQEAHRLALQATELEPHSMLTLSTSCLVESALGNGDVALRQGMTAARYSGRDPLTVAISAIAEMVRGNVPRADALYRELLVRAEHETVLHFALAMAACSAGRVDEAVDHGIASFRAHELLPSQLLRSTLFDGLRRHPRYPELLAAHPGRPGSISSPPA